MGVHNHFYFLHLLCVPVCTHLCHSTHVKAMRQFWELVLFFSHVGSRDQSQAISLVASPFT